MSECIDNDGFWRYLMAFDSNTAIRNLRDEAEKQTKLLKEQNRKLEDLTAAVLTLASSVQYFVNIKLGSNADALSHFGHIRETIKDRKNP